LKPVASTSSSSTSSNASHDDKMILLKYSTTEKSLEEVEVELNRVKDGLAQSLLAFNLELNYDFWTSDQILRAMLPEEIIVPTAFETVGHIAHVNLRDDQLDYKYLIGQVLLDKNVQIKTVVNKTDNIDNTFRFFKMEVIAGVNDTMAELKENGVTFRFDFSQVYWNSRLHTEHQRLVDLFRPREIVLDMFAGVGPFAIPAAKKGCVIYANDLNPNSYKFLVENARINKVEKKLFGYNLDGRDFLLKVAEQQAQLHKKDQGEEAESKGVILKSKLFHHVIMNLPAIAIEFLDVFTGLFRKLGFSEQTDENLLPKIHCHCFSANPDDPEGDVRNRVEEIIRGKFTTDHLSNAEKWNFHHVRSVAPNKDMFCLSFLLPHSIAFSENYYSPKKRTEGEEKSQNEEGGGEALHLNKKFKETDE